MIGTNETARPRSRLVSASEKGCEGLLEFFASLKIGHNETIVSFHGKQKVKSNKLTSYISELVQELSHDQYKYLWENIKDSSIVALREFAQNNEDEQKKKEICDALEYISILCLASIQPDNKLICDGLINTVLILHGSLLGLSSSGPKLAKSICRVCIQWWKNNLVKKECICVNALVYMLNNILDPGFTEKASTSISDICELQKSLHIFDFSDQQFNNKSQELDQADVIQELRQLITSAILHPAFLRHINGRKFLSNLLLLHKDLMKEMHSAIINHVSTSSNNKLGGAYGHIYFQAWTIADEIMKENLEDFCIQDIMYRAMHAPHGKLGSHDLFATYRSVLQGITSHNGLLQVRHMITRLYNPIIWRSLKALNAMVRANAAHLLFDAFPLMDVSDTTENDELLQRQFTTIDELLMDAYPQIRSIAVIGLCDKLKLFWDVIPAHVIAVQTRNLYTNLAFDSSSSLVRLSVFQGTIMLLSNPCSHPLLLKLLPSIGLCLHDTNEKVRIAVADVLLAVKQTSTIKFWDICSIDKILAQLEIENTTATIRLVKLLSGSFLPRDQPMQTWVERCDNFYKRNPTAARKFYLYAKDQLNSTEAGEFIFAMSVFIFNHVSISLEKDCEEQDENISDTTSNIMENTNTIAGLLDTICILWLTYSQKKDSNSSTEMQRKFRELNKRVVVNLPRMVHVCFRRYHDERNLNALLQISACLQPASMPIFSKKLLPKLKSLPDDTTSSYYEMLINCAVKWGWGVHVAELIYDWLKPSEDEETTQRKSKKTRSGKSGKKRNVQFNVAENESRPSQALKYLACFLDDDDAIHSLLLNEDFKKYMLDISKCLQNYVMELLSRLHGNKVKLHQLDDMLLTCALEFYFKLLSHLYFAADKPLNNSNELDDLKKLIDLMHDQAAGGLKNTSQTTQSQFSANISTSMSCLNEVSSTPLTRKFFDIVFPSIIRLLKCGIDVTDQALSFVCSFANAGLKLINHAGWMCELYNEIFEWKLLHVWSKDNETESSLQYESEETLTKIFDDIIIALMTYSRRNPDGFQEMFRSKIRSHMRSFMDKSFQLCAGVTKLSHGSITKKLLSAMFVDIIHNTANCENSPRPITEDLPPFCASFLPIICGTSHRCEYVCKITIPAMFSHDESNGRDAAIKACSVILQSLIKDGKNSSLAITCLQELTEKDPDLLEKN